MAPFKSGSVLSSTLQEITNTKLQELSKRRDDYGEHRQRVVAALAKEIQPIRRLQILSKGVKRCFGVASDDDDDDDEGGDGQDKRTSDNNNNVGALDDFHSSGLATLLDNLDLFISQARYDPSVSAAMASNWEADLLKHLDMRSLKFEYASLYAQLVTEWLSMDKDAASSTKATTDSSHDGDVGMADDDFEDLGLAAKRESRAEFEQQVFTSANLDEAALTEYLTDIFGTANPNDAAYQGYNDALKALREQVKATELNLATPTQFTGSVLAWVSDGLIASGSLSDETRQVLQDFKKQPLVMDEVADVLNMRMQSLESWSWGPQGVNVDQERQINGRYDIVMHEDLLQALMLYFIGVKFSVRVKRALRIFRKSRDSAWVSPVHRIDSRERARRKYYIGREDTKDSAQALRDRVYRKHYFLSALKSSDAENVRYDPAEMEAVHQPSGYAPDLNLELDYGMEMPMSPAFSPSSPVALQAMIRAAPRMKKMKRTRRDVDTESETEDDDDEVPDTDNESDVEQDESATGKKDAASKSLSAIKQRLLRLLSTEININTKLHGEVTAVRSSFVNWHDNLPHETILCVLSFLGFSRKWLAFFEKVLAAPLRFGEDGPSATLRDRKRGTPESRTLSDLFGETALFCLDLAVNRATGGANIWRLQHEFWFWSRDLATAEKMWAAVQRFREITGTVVSTHTSGSVRVDANGTSAASTILPRGDIRWGLLHLSPTTGEFDIDQRAVDKQIYDLRKQLYSKRGSLIGFLQSWNAYASTFFTHNFGRPANCFGRKHVEAILDTHNRIQREIFAPQPSPLVSLTAQHGAGAGGQDVSTNMVDFLKSELHRRFGVTDVPDAFLFFPADMGGLDLASPFIQILQVHKTVLADPAARLDKFLDDEQRAHRKLAKSWSDSGRESYDEFVSKNKENGATSGDTQSYAKRPRSTPTLEAAAAGSTITGTATAEPNFITFDEFIKYREQASPSAVVTEKTSFHGLGDVYRDLLRLPSEGGVIDVDQTVLVAVKCLGYSHSNGGIANSMNAMKPYWKWILAVYGKEVVDRFGGLRIVEPGLLPMGMVRMLKDRKVNWEA